MYPNNPGAISPCQKKSKALPIKLFFALSLFGLIGAVQNSAFAQCSSSSSSLGISWNVTRGDGNDKAVILLYSESAGGDAQEAQVDLFLQSSLASGATVTADFSGGWLYQSGAGTSSIVNGGTGITCAYSRSACNFKSGSGLLCVIYVNNNGVFLDVGKLVDGGEGIVLLEDIN
jgi:hypothetical protein